MQVFFLRFAKFVTIFFFIIAKIFNQIIRNNIDVIIIGNYNHITVDQKLMLDCFEKEGFSYRFVFTTEKPKFIDKFFSYIKLASILPTAKNVIVFDYCFPIYCCKKLNGQKHLQLWHGNGSFKRFGMPNFYKKYGQELGSKLYKIVPIHSTYDYVFVSNEKCVYNYMEAFNIHEKERFIISNNMILNLITDAVKNDGRKIYNPKEITVICAPTYNYFPDEDIYGMLEQELINQGKELGIEVEFLKLLHPKLAPSFDKIGTLMKTDYLITDYSSVCFEAAGAGVQVAFLRSHTTEDVYLEAAVKIYKDPAELANDILHNQLEDSHLTDYLCEDSDKKQLDIVVELIYKNRK